MTLISTAARGGSGGGNTVKIFDSTLGADAASFDIASISAAYAALQIVLQVRATNAAASAIVLCRFNNDSGANYDYEYTYAQGVTPSAAQTLATTALALGDCPGATATAGYAATIEAVIANYAGTTFNKVCSSRCGNPIGTASGNVFSELICGHWRTTATAINRVTILPSANNFLAGSRCTVYGWNIS